MGLGEVGRGFAAAFESSQIPFGIVDFRVGNQSRHSDTSWSHREVANPNYDTTLVCVNPDNSYALRMNVSRSILGDRYVIGNWFWELPELPDEWTRDFAFVDEIWAPTRFVQDAIAEKSPVPVVRIPPVVKVALDRPLPRSHFGLPERRFLFLAMADARSVLDRKNPLGAIRAFKSAFAANDESVGLVLKFNNPDVARAGLQALREEAEDYRNIFFLDRVYTRQEVNALVAAIDCYVSLHRSEGFGLGPAEAMYLGKPAIVTNWSGNTDYMANGNSAAVDYELVKLGRDFEIYRGHQSWAEPDISHAADWMRKLVQEPSLASDMGRRGQATIKADFSPERVGQLVTRRLDRIRRFT
jgi:glycosyltransferase involved in cell wall biosynthesis